MVLLFPQGDSDEDGYWVLPRFFLPEGAIEDRERKDHVSYSNWARQGLVTLTDGDVIDYRFIRKQVNDDRKRYKVVEIGYDPWNAETLCNQQLGQEDGFKVVEVRQSIPSDSWAATSKKHRSNVADIGFGYRLTKWLDAES